MAFILDPEFEKYATPKQWEKLKAWEQHGSTRPAADAVGCHHAAINQAWAAVKKKAAMYGFAPEHGWQHETPPGYVVKGVSTLRDMQTGEARLQWEKTEREREGLKESVQALVGEFCDDLPTVKPRKSCPKSDNDELMSVIPMGDPHFGMYSWAEEAGEDFDLAIARRDMCSAVNYLVNQSPTSKRCVIINLGDFFHVDNLKNMTAQSGNVLDVDSRLPLMIRVGLSALRQAIETALDRHEIVEIINVIGNHDGVLAMALSIMLANIYEREPRIVVHDQPTPRHYIEHGKVLIGTTHGDRTKDRDLPGIMATERAEEWGRTKFRYFYRGHHHHDTMEMFNGCVVEQFSTLAPNDAWHNAGGYLTGRNMKLIVHHRQYGEVARSVCSIDMARDDVV